MKCRQQSLGMMRLSKSSRSLWWGTVKPEPGRLRRGQRKRTRTDLASRFSKDHSELISLQVEGLYYAYESLSMKGGKLKRENFQTVDGLVGWGSGDGREQILKTQSTGIMHISLFPRKQGSL